MIYNYSTNLGETILGGNDMSIVRYVNKKTGTVTLYESTSHYDTATKQSRPSRKYLGREDPITKELIPSTGKRGRKKEEARQQVYGRLRLWPFSIFPSADKGYSPIFRYTTASG